MGRPARSSPAAPATTASQDARVMGTDDSGRRTMGYRPVTRPAARQPSRPDQRRTLGGPMPGSVIVAGARTPIGKLSGALAGFTAMDLGGFAIAAALERAGVRARPGRLRADGPGASRPARARSPPARPPSRRGIPMTVPATTVNKVCLSGLNAIYLADQMINAGDAEIVVAGGMESMTQAPHLLPGARAGFRLGDATLVDSMMYDGLTCAFDQCAMGLVHRAVQPGGRHHPGAPGRLRRRLATRGPPPPPRTGRLAEEIVPVSVPQRKGDPVVVDTDEGVRPGHHGRVPGRPAAGLRQGGHHHRRQRLADLRRRRPPWSSCRRAKAERARASPPSASWSAYGQVAGPDTSLLHPAVAGHRPGPGARPA